VADGSLGERGDKMRQWLQSQANAGVLFVGFCELVGWQELESRTDLMKNHEKIFFRAANAGFTYAHIMQTPSQQNTYPIGIVAVLPFEVMGEYQLPSFQRGVLHVYFPSLHLNVFVVHLHAHSSSLRLVEANRLVAIMQPLLDTKQKIVVMGDFNTLSSYDQTQHRDSKLLELLQRADHTVSLDVIIIALCYILTLDPLFSV
jgi:endonuclease/exonuclease/phosphatase family metal-dependent hydrolase